MRDLAKSAAQASIMAVQQPTQAVAVESYLNAYEYAMNMLKEKQQRKEVTSIKENFGPSYPSYIDPNHPDDPDYDDIFSSPRL